MEEEIYFPDKDSHWSLSVKKIMRPIPNSTVGQLKFYFLRFLYPNYVIADMQPEYTVPDPELNLWYVFIGLSIIISIVFYVVYKEIAPILDEPDPIINPYASDAKKAPKTNQSVAFIDREIIEMHESGILCNEGEANLINISGLSDGEGMQNLSQNQMNLGLVGDSRIRRDYSHGDNLFNYTE